MLVDGVFAPELSDLGDLEEGLEIRTLREVLESGRGQLNRLIVTQAVNPTAAEDNSDPMIALNAR